jgi:hypothetical protein
MTAKRDLQENIVLHGVLEASEHRLAREGPSQPAPGLHDKGFGLQV